MSWPTSALNIRSWPTSDTKSHELTYCTSVMISCQLTCICSKGSRVDLHQTWNIMSWPTSDTKSHRLTNIWYKISQVDHHLMWNLMSLTYICPWGARSHFALWFDMKQWTDCLLCCHERYWWRFQEPGQIRQASCHKVALASCAENNADHHLLNMNLFKILEFSASHQLPIAISCKSYIFYLMYRLQSIEGRNNILKIKIDHAFTISVEH